MGYKGNLKQQKKWSDAQKLEYDLKIHSELAENYSLITKMVLICLRKNLKMVIENPYNQPHYLTRYWAIEPKVVDLDRRNDGDYYKKPTQYWFINMEPKNNLVFEPLDYVEQRIVENCEKGKMRSEIHPQYANRFIRKYLIESEE